RQAQINSNSNITNNSNSTNNLSELNPLVREALEESMRKSRQLLNDSQITKPKTGYEFARDWKRLAMKLSLLNTTNSGNNNDEKIAIKQLLHKLMNTAPTNNNNNNELVTQQLQAVSLTNNTTSMPSNNCNFNNANGSSYPMLLSPGWSNILSSNNTNTNNNNPN